MLARMLLALAIFLPACAQSEVTTAAQNPRIVADPPRRILFIGNSLTYFNDGVYSHLQRLMASAVPPVAIEADKAVVGGQYFRTLWDQFPEPRQAIARGYDVIVLQEDLPETKVADFRQYAPKFVEEIRKTGGRPVFYMAWAYQRLGWISMAEIAQVHREVGKELGVDVAPVGLAWERAMKERPRLDLFDPDREHPNVHGTYLATAVIYATVFRKSPVELPYVPRGVNADDGAFLRRIAWETVEAWSK